jgi:hypothetical protein
MAISLTKETASPAPASQQATVHQMDSNEKMRAKTVGADISSTKENATMFLSLHKSTSYVRPDGSWLQFSNRHYETDNEQDITFLKEQRNFGSEIFIDEYPRHVAERFKWERENVTIIPEDDQYTGSKT